MDNRNTKSEVLKKFQQLLELNKTGTTPRAYRGHLEKFLDYTNKPPLRVTNEDFLDYNIYINKFSASYQQQVISAVKLYFKLFLKKKPKDFAFIRPKKEIKIPEVFDAEILALKIKAVENLKHRLILAIGISSWLRQGELRNLKIADIDFDRKVIKIHQSKGAKDREVRLSERLAELIKLYLVEYCPDTYLLNGQSKPKYASINKVCQNHLGFRYHCLRASGATYAVRRGVDIVTVSRMLGHNSVETTKAYLPNLFETVVSAF